MEKARTTPPEIEIAEAENPQKAEEPISISLPIPFHSNRSRSSFEEFSTSSLSSTSPQFIFSRCRDLYTQLRYIPYYTIR